MRFLVQDWEIITKVPLYNALTEEGIDFDLLPTNIHEEKNADFDIVVDKVKTALKKKKYDAMFSINFSDKVAMACHELDIPYIAWCYDSPAFGGRHDTHQFETNHVFVFDSNELEEHKKAGDADRMYFMNLAAPYYKIETLKGTPMERIRFQSDISFVGQLYLSEMEEIMASLNPYKAAYVDSLINMQLQNYNINLIKKVVTGGVANALYNEEFADAIRRKMHIELHSSEDKRKRGVLSMFLNRAVTARERVILLNLLSSRYQVRLFSQDKHDMLPNISYGGIVDYVSEMPKVFYNSKINLNITVRSIETGVPQRCIDILGCRGFLLTNEQKDLYTELEDKKDIVVYHSMEEAVELADYYLKHESEREKIAQNGYKKAKDCFSYHSQLDKILRISGLRS